MAIIKLVEGKIHLPMHLEGEFYKFAILDKSGAMCYVQIAARHINDLMVKNKMKDVYDFDKYKFTLVAE